MSVWIFCLSCTFNKWLTRKNRNTPSRSWNKDSSKQQLLLWLPSSTWLSSNLRRKSKLTIFFFSKPQKSMKLKDLCFDTFILITKLWFLSNPLDFRVLNTVLNICVISFFVLVDAENILVDAFCFKFKEDSLLRCL